MKYAACLVEISFAKLMTSKRSTPHMKNYTVIDLDDPLEFDALTDLLRSSAKRLNAEAIQAELDEL